MIDTFGPVALATLADPGTHPCPGVCGRAVYRHRFACAMCWHRLPVGLRRAITVTCRPGDEAARADALVAAMDWYTAMDRQAFAMEVVDERTRDAAGLEY